MLLYIAQFVVHALRESPPDKAFPAPERPDFGGQPEADPLELDEQAAWLCCRACSAELAPASAVFAPGDTPLVFANPAGMVFELRAVRVAPGVFAFGESTTDATWFSGYAWCVALCARCHHHVGWKYLSVGSAKSPAEFFGLILREIIESR